MKTPPANRSRTRSGALRTRRGAMSVFAMVSLLIVAGLGAGLLRLAAIERRHARDEERQLQAEWLAESALARAKAQLASNRDYRGEVWTPLPSTLGRGRSGRVEISVGRGDAQPSRVEVRVQADLLSGPETRDRQSKTAFVEVPPQSVQTTSQVVPLSGRDSS